MLDFLKKLILSNKYSLLVLLILSLWLRLAKDYSIILSYIVLLILYLAIGIVVSYVLDLFESKKSVKDTTDEAETKRASVSVAKKREVIGHREIQRHSSEQSRVTSSYVKNADGLSSSMSKRLERTAATFNSMKDDSDKFAEEEKKQSNLYGNTRNILFENPEDLYTNKKTDKKPSIKETPIETVNDNDKLSEKDKKDFFESDIFGDIDGYSAASSDEVNDIIKDVDSRVNEPRRVRKPWISDKKEISFEPTVTPKPAIKGRPLDIANREVKPKEVIKPAEPVKTQTPVVPPKQPRKTHVVVDNNQDSVNADMDKLDKLFNRSRNKDDGRDDKPKSGLFSGFKKKRK